MRIFLVVSLLMVSSCSWFAQPDTSILDTTTLSKPTIQFQAPVKQMLSPFEWDFPRTQDESFVKKSKKCLDEAKLAGFNTKLVYKNVDLEISEQCKIPSVDVNSNIYIGLTEADFRTVVTNYQILLMREKRWESLLDAINKTLSEGVK